MSREILVVKVGGREIAPGLGVKAFAHWVAAVHQSGHDLVIVHGGGDEVTGLAEKLGLETKKVEGQRVTTPEILPLVIQVLAGEVNSRVVAAIRQVGLSPVGLTGLSGQILTATPILASRLGLVGEPESVSMNLLHLLLSEGHIPVLAPLAPSDEGQVLNVNADLVAAAVASALGADLVLVTDVDGVRDAAGQLVEKLTPSAATALLANGAARDGMRPKLRASLQALSGGAASVWIGRLEDALPEASARLAGTSLVPEPGLPSHSSPVAVQAEGR